MRGDHDCPVLSGGRCPLADEADAIIVLTGGQSRIDAAVDLLKSGKGKRLLISGVHPAASRAASTSARRRISAC